MFAYYSSTTFLIWLALGVLCLLVHENARIHARDKGLLYLTYVLIAVSALAEYVGIWINGREQISRAALLAVKALDYILTPLSGAAIILQLKPTKKWKWFLGGVVAVNTVLQLLNSPDGVDGGRR